MCGRRSCFALDVRGSEFGFHEGLSDRARPYFQTPCVRRQTNLHFQYGAGHSRLNIHKFKLDQISD